jgi:hypothetical protein
MATCTSLRGLQLPDIVVQCILCRENSICLNPFCLGETWCKEWDSVALQAAGNFSAAKRLARSSESPALTALPFTGGSTLQQP